MATPRDPAVAHPAREVLSSASTIKAEELQAQLKVFLADLQSRPTEDSEEAHGLDSTHQEALESLLADEPVGEDEPSVASPEAAKPEGEEEDVEDGYLENGAPCIVWHSSNRVRLATNLPAELKGKAISQVATGPIPDLWDDNFLPVQKKSTVRPLATLRARAQKVTRLCSIFHAAVQYGAWYLPPKKWCMPSADGDRFNSGETNQADADINSMKQEMEQEIVKLYSARMFRAFIKRRGEQLPKYLQRIDSPVDRR